MYQFCGNDFLGEFVVGSCEYAEGGGNGQVAGVARVAQVFG